MVAPAAGTEKGRRVARAADPTSTPSAAGVVGDSHTASTVPSNEVPLPSTTIVSGEVVVAPATEGAREVARTARPDASTTPATRRGGRAGRGASRMKILGAVVNARSGPSWVGPVSHWLPAG